MEVFVVIETFSRDNLSLCEIGPCAHSVIQCLRQGSSKQSRTGGQVSGVLILLNQPLAAGGPVEMSVSWHSVRGSKQFQYPQS